LGKGEVAVIEWLTPGFVEVFRHVAAICSPGRRVIGNIYENPELVKEN